MQLQQSEVNSGRFHALLTPCSIYEMIKRTISPSRRYGLVCSEWEFFKGFGGIVLITSSLSVVMKKLKMWRKLTTLGCESRGGRFDPLFMKRLLLRGAYFVVGISARRGNS